MKENKEIMTSLLRCENLECSHCSKWCFDHAFIGMRLEFVQNLYQTHYREGCFLDNDKNLLGSDLRYLEEATYVVADYSSFLQRDLVCRAETKRHSSASLYRILPM